MSARTRASGAHVDVFTPATARVARSSISARTSGDPVPAGRPASSEGIARPTWKFTTTWAPARACAAYDVITRTSSCPARRARMRDEYVAVRHHLPCARQSEPRHQAAPSDFPRRRGYRGMLVASADGSSPESRRTARPREPLRRAARRRRLVPCGVERTEPAPQPAPAQGVRHRRRRVPRAAARPLVPRKGSIT